MTDPAELVRAHLLASAEVQRLAAEQCAAPLAEAAARCAEALRRGGKLLFCGNGGSAADCQHLAAEFVNVLDRSRPRRALAAIALTTDSSVLTATANDLGFEEVFSRQVEALGRPGDILVGISTSGESANTLRALKRARESGLSTVLLTGEREGSASSFADVTVRAPAGETALIQEVHLALGHSLCLAVELLLSAHPGPGPNAHD